MSKASVKAVIDAAIKQNGTKSITGTVLNSVLNQMVDEVPDVVNDKTTGGAGKAWSAEQGKGLSADVSQLAQEVDEKSEVVDLLGSASGASGTFDLSQYEHLSYFINSSGKWTATPNNTAFSVVIPITPGKFKITAGATQSIFAFLSAEPVAETNVSFGTVNGVAQNSRITLSAGTSGTYQILSTDTSLYLVVRDDVSGVLKPTIEYEADVVLNVPLNSDFTPVKNKVEDLDAFASEIIAKEFGVSQGVGLQIGKGWMDNAGTVKYFDNSTHFVIPIKKGDRLVVVPHTNQSIFAFLKSYTKPTANGQSYNLCTGTSVTTISTTNYPTVPDDAVFLYVGIVGNGNDHLPVSVFLNGLDVIDARYNTQAELSLLQNTALPAATYLPTANTSFDLVYGKVKKGDRIYVKGDTSGTAASAFFINYAFFDVEPEIGIDSSHLISHGQSNSVYDGLYLISAVDGYFAAHFRFVSNNVTVTNTLEILTVGDLQDLSFATERRVYSLESKVKTIEDEIVNTSAIHLSRNSYNSPLFNCHRGVQAYGPENSLPAFLAGGTYGVWAIETDFQLTSDGEVVCMHDSTINRTMVNMDGTPIEGDVYVNQKTLAELRADYKIAEVNSTVISNKQYDYSQFTNDELVIPTMDEYFSICQQYGLVPFIELKQDNGVIAKMMAAIKKYRLEGKCVVSAIPLNLLQAYRQQGGKEYIHHIFTSVSDFDTLLALGNCGVSFQDITDLDADISGQYVYGDYDPSTPEELVQMCHSLGLLICFRADDDRTNARKAIEIGLDYMPTNNLWLKSQID